MPTDGSSTMVHPRLVQALSGVPRNQAFDDDPVSRPATVVQALGGGPQSRALGGGPGGPRDSVRRTMAP